MPEKAHVTSLEALESFRAALILYVNKARPTVEEVSSDVLRTKLWLENEQRMHWENQVRQRKKAFEQAQQALSSARMSNLRQATSAEQMMVQRTKRALEEAEAKLKILKYWNREFDSRAEPLVKQLQKLHTFLAHDMLQANAYLVQAINTLAAYADVAPVPMAATPGPPTEAGKVGEATVDSKQE